MFCYTAAGWLDSKFYVPAVRIEQDIRQDCAGYDWDIINAGVDTLLKAYPHNRLVRHLANNCCLTYHCPAARNYFMGRWECPVPSSPACNANCIGCISFQPQEETIPSTQDRLTFKPSAEEIVEFTVPHLQSAPFPIVSFGQGCEGEPLADVGDAPRSHPGDAPPYRPRQYQHQHQRQPAGSGTGTLRSRTGLHPRKS